MNHCIENIQIGSQGFWLLLISWIQENQWEIAFQTYTSQIYLLLRLSFRNFLCRQNSWWGHPPAATPSNLLQYPMRSPSFGGCSSQWQGMAGHGTVNRSMASFVAVFVLGLPFGWPTLFSGLHCSLNSLLSNPFLFCFSVRLALYSKNLSPPTPVLFPPLSLYFNPKFSIFGTCFLEDLNWHNLSTIMMLTTLIHVSQS